MTAVFRRKIEIMDWTEERTCRESCVTETTRLKKLDQLDPYSTARSRKYNQGTTVERVGSGREGGVFTSYPPSLLEGRRPRQSDEGSFPSLGSRISHRPTYRGVG